MSLYYFSVALHLLAMTVWIGHMLFWSLIVGPITKRFEPPATGKLLRELSVRKGGLGWPCLGVLIVTGIIMLYYKGVTWQSLASGDLFSTPYGCVLALKLIFVGGMILYQSFIGHRSAPKLVYADMLAAFVVIALSILLTRSVVVGNPDWDFKIPQPYLKGDSQAALQDKGQTHSIGKIKFTTESNSLIWKTIPRDSGSKR